MNVIEKIKNDLKFIEKKGDLYDAISKKRNVVLDNILFKSIKYQTFLFSRILYLLIHLTTKTKNFLTPLEKIKKAEDEIKEYLGIPHVDILRSKDIGKELALLYSFYSEDFYDLINYTIKKEKLLHYLNKIEKFCEEFAINKIYIQKSDVSSYLSNENLKNYRIRSYSSILKFEDTVLNNYLVEVNQNELKELISEIEAHSIDYDFIFSLDEKIEDEIIKKAIQEFRKDYNIKKLLDVVKSRLQLHLNDEMLTKNKKYGKVYDQIDLSETFIRILRSDSKGNPVEQNIFTLYDYLETHDFASLEKSIMLQDDQLEIKVISLLYLFLIGEKEIKQEDKENENPSLYDYMYLNYKKKIKKIPWIRTKFQKFEGEQQTIMYACFNILLAWLIVLFIALPALLGSPDNLFFHNYKYITSSFWGLYEKSYQFEEELLNKFKNQIAKLFPNKASEDIVKYSQEIISNTTSNEDKCVAEIEWFSKEKMPLYFVDEAAFSGFFYSFTNDKGINYCNFKDVEVTEDLFENVRPLFQIKASVSKEALEEASRHYRIDLPLDFFPVGDNYSLIEIYIKDEEDPTKVVHIDINAIMSQITLSEEDREILKSIETPMVYSVYGLSQKENHSIFPDYMEADYIENPKEVKEIILESFSLENDATIEEISEAIGSKDYLKNPNFKKGNDEIEYYENIASLDCVNIDIALSLLLGADDDLIYTVGFKNNDNNDAIMMSESYIWAMTKEGKVIDVLESFIKESVKEENDSLQEQNESIVSEVVSYEERKEKEYSLNISEAKENEAKEDDVLKEIFDWMKAYKVPFYIGVFLITLIFYKLFGKRVQFMIKLSQAQSVLKREDHNEIYAKLMEFIYGGINIPTERTENELIDKIYKDFNAFSTEEIETILKAIKEQNKEYNPDCLKAIYKMLKNIPFIIEEKELLKEKNVKKLKLGGHYE